MNILIVEDDRVSSTLIKAILSPYGRCDTVADGKSAVTAFNLSLVGKKPYGLVCLDIMLPELDGLYVLKQLRKQEEEYGINGLDRAKIIMVTALDDHRNIMDAFRSQCEGYIVKPIRKDRVINQLCELGIVSPEKIASE